MKVLDLQTFQKRTMEIILPDGERLFLNKPSQKLVIKMMGIEDTVKHAGDDPEKISQLYTEVLRDILNNNTDKKGFSTEYIENTFDFEVGQVLLTAYMEFLQEVQSDPNLKSPASRGKNQQEK